MVAVVLFEYCDSTAILLWLMTTIQPEMRFPYVDPHDVVKY